MEIEDQPASDGGSAPTASSNGNGSSSNGHRVLAGNGLFAEAFDAGDVTWVDDQPEFVRLGHGLAQGQLARVVLPGPVPAEPEAPLVRPPAPAPVRPGTAAPASTHEHLPTAPLPELARRPRTITARAQPDGALGITPMHLAWLFLLPVAVVAVVAGVLAPVLARWFMPTATWSVLPTVRKVDLIAPEPDEQLRYLTALGSVVVLAALVGLAWKQLSGAPRGRRLTLAVTAMQVGGVVLAAASLYEQELHRHWFSGGDVLAAVGIAGVLLLAARSAPALMPGPRLAVAMQSPARRRVAKVLALVMVVVVSGLWLLPAVFHDSNVADADGAVRGHLQFTMDEFLSATNGRTALVDFIPQYSRLLPFVLEPVFGLFGATVGTFTWTMWVFSVASMVAVYLLFRVVTGGPIAALVPYAPFLAVSTVAVRKVGDERITLANLYGVVPLRVLGPFVVACLCAYELRRPRRGRSLALFFLAGLVVINNPEFGLPCFVAAGVALWCGRRRPGGWRQALVLLSQAGTGALASIALVSVFILARTSELPRWDYANHFARIFAVEGFGMVRMPLLGLHVIMYMTFVGALMAAVGASIKPTYPRNRVLVGMLAYSGVLGLGAFSYWVGRSHPDALFGMFPTWGLSVGLLGWWVLSSVALRSNAKSAVSPRVGVLALPSFAVLVVFSLMLLLARQFPAPAEQVHRLTSKAEVPWTGLPRQASEAPFSFDGAEASKFVSRYTRSGEHVAILSSLGHGVAERSGVVNVSPYAHPDVIVFSEQMAFFLRSIDDADASKIFLGPTYPEIPTFLQLAGYSMTALDETSRLSLWERSR